MHYRNIIVTHTICFFFFFLLLSLIVVVVSLLLMKGPFIYAAMLLFHASVGYTGSFAARSIFHRLC